MKKIAYLVVILNSTYIYTVQVSPRFKTIQFQEEQDTQQIWSVDSEQELTYKWLKIHAITHDGTQIGAARWPINYRIGEWIDIEPHYHEHQNNLKSLLYYIFTHKSLEHCPALSIKIPTSCLKLIEDLGLQNVTKSLVYGTNPKVTGTLTFDQLQKIVSFTAC
jgi:hypothetical protein